MKNGCLVDWGTAGQLSVGSARAMPNRGNPRGSEERYMQY